MVEYFALLHALMEAHPLEAVNRATAWVDRAKWLDLTKFPTLGIPIENSLFSFATRPCGKSVFRAEIEQ